jgi:hypothetical protein
MTPAKPDEEPEAGRQGIVPLRWSRLSEQIFRFDKWSLRRD